MIIRVLLVDDSPSFRMLARATMEAFPELVLAGEASDGLEAVERTLALQPDVIVMDVQMPGIDGLEATRRIMARAPAPVVIVSTTSPGDVHVSISALGAGALAALPKPPGVGHPEHEAAWRALWRTVRSMAGVRVVRRWRRGSLTSELASERPVRRPEVVAMAASTGGPAALAAVLAALPGDLAAPVLVVQHIASGFVPGLARWLDSAGPLAVKVAEEDEPLVPGTVYLAPTDRHLEVDPARRVAKLGVGPARGGFRPSATVLFESVARAWGDAAMGVILTGMGRDGVDGLRTLRDAGGRVVAQDEATSVVYGMPGAAVREGAADYVLGLPSIARFVSHTVRGAA